MTIPVSVKAIDGRSGTNNIPVAELSKRGARVQRAGSQRERRQGVVLAALLMAGAKPRALHVAGLTRRHLISKKRRRRQETPGGVELPRRMLGIVGLAPSAALTPTRRSRWEEGDRSIRRSVDAAWRCRRCSPRARHRRAAEAVRFRHAARAAGPGDAQLIDAKRLAVMKAARSSQLRA